MYIDLSREMPSQVFWFFLFLMYVSDYTNKRDSQKTPLTIEKETYASKIRFLILYYIWRPIVILFLKRFHIISSSATMWQRYIMEEYEEMENNASGVFDVSNTTAIRTSLRKPEYEKLSQSG